MSGTVPEVPPAAEGGGGGGKALTLGEASPQLAAALVAHLGLASTFESSAKLHEAARKIHDAATIQDAAIEPMRAAMLDFAGAIRWGFLVFHMLGLTTDGARAPGLPFDLGAYNNVVARVYDAGFKEQIIDPVAEEPESEEEEEDSSEESEEAEDVEAAAAAEGAEGEEDE